MQNQTPATSAPPRDRGGFTLLELLIVIVIIALLAGLLLPAINAASQKARMGRVRQEISQLEASIVAFKNRFGIEPPSQFRLYDDFSWYLVDDAAGAGTPQDQARLKSVGVIRRLWPQFDFSLARDWDGDGDTTTQATEGYTLTGAECLVFFLGGIIDTGAGLPNLTGFSKNPRAPFAASTGTRDGPFYEFAASRIQDRITTAMGGNDLIPEYVDSLGVEKLPYLYINSNDGSGYDASHLPLAIPFDNVATEGLQLRDGIYRQSETANSFYKPKTFQIISPGFDGDYGHGGVYEEDDFGHDDRDNLTVNNTEHVGPADRDNITNFTDLSLRE